MPNSVGASLLIAMLLLLLSSAFYALPVYAEDDEDEHENENENESELAKALGSTAATLGLMLVVGFMVYKHMLPHLRRLGIKPLVKYRSVVLYHAISSVILGLMALVHGYMLRGCAGAVEYALAVLIVVVLVTGSLLLWGSGRRVVFFARIIHTQRLLSIILLVLHTLHVALMD